MRAAWGSLLLCVGLACGDARDPSPPDATPEASAWVGDGACGGCHPEALAAWKGSHHDRAMQPADASTVQGDFAGAVLEHRGERFSFARRGERFVIETAGADGAVRAFEVAYTFGVEPLQQYLVRLPGGRLHAVAAAWDTRPAAQGGQRWFHLQPDTPVPPGDPLHWTGLAGSWNAMCAECHSTGYEKGYRADEGAYTSSWSSIDVSCEACHGPASTHVAWAEAGADLAADPRKGLTVALGAKRAWRFAEGAEIAERAPSAADRTEIEACAPCHARRSRIATDAPPGVPFLDAFSPALLDPGLYHADGQIQDEVYVWGSFVQSRMHAAGVVCSDCHDPHALRIDEPDAVCAGCHAPAVFASPDHHHHAEGSPGASCVACHMPARTYMVVDERRDHGLRIPRLDVAREIGAPDACSGCHADRKPAWAADAVRRWNGRPTRSAPHFGKVLHAGRRRAPDASADLAALAGDARQPAIVRATAVRWLSAQLTASTRPALRAALDDPEALVRLAAAGALDALPPRERLAAGSPRLADPVRAVRIEAARALASFEAHLTDPAARRALDAALAEYVAAQQWNADRPEAQTNLGNLYARRGELLAAQRAYEAALRLAPWFVPASLHLAELHRQGGREDDVLQVLRRALAHAPEAAPLHHALGLAQVRRGRRDEALPLLARATELAPDRPRFAYVYAIALDAVGERERATGVLEAARHVHPGDPDLLLGLATLARDAGRLEAAREHAERLRALRPDDPTARALVRELGPAERTSE